MSGFGRRNYRAVGRDRPDKFELLSVVLLTLAVDVVVLTADMLCPAENIDADEFTDVSTAATPSFID